jgi:hypothetical protein
VQLADRRAVHLLAAKGPDQCRPQRDSRGDGPCGAGVRHRDDRSRLDLGGQSRSPLAGLLLTQRREPEIPVVAHRLAVAQEHHLVVRFRHSHV